MLTRLLPKRSQFLCLVLASLLLGACSQGSGVTLYSATGSWSGTLTTPDRVAHPVEAVMTPDGYFHLRMIDTGDQFFATVAIRENYGEAPAQLVRPAQLVSYRGFLKLAVAASSMQGLLALGLDNWEFTLSQMPDARAPANMTGLQTAWSASDLRRITSIRIASDLTLTGRYNNCSWGGTVSEVSADWNIYRLTATASACEYQDLEGHYSGLVMLVPGPGGMDLRFMIAAPDAGYALGGRWFETVNLGPRAVVGADFSVNIPTGGPVALDGRASSDPNLDPLDYRWSVVSTPPLPPGVLPPVLTEALTATPHFVPPVAGADPYVFQLVVSDGRITSEPVYVNIKVLNIVERRFSDNGDGTVTDHLTNLIWLKHADCFGQVAALPIVDGDPNNAYDLAATLQSGNGSDNCGLTDGSLRGDWRLPTLRELVSLVDPYCSEPSKANPVFFGPALSNAQGDGHWQEGDPFTQVRSAPYWTADYDPNFDWTNYFVDLRDGSNDSMTIYTPNHIWPVRNPLPAPVAAGQ